MVLEGYGRSWEMLEGARMSYEGLVRSLRSWEVLAGTGMK